MGYIMDLRKIVGARPLIMAGACVLLIDSQDRILLQLRTDNGTWGLPGGSLEPGESMESVARRELLEEVGLTAGDMSLLDIFSGEKFYYKYPHGDEVYNVIAAYVCRDYQGDIRIDEGEVQETKFFSLHDLPELINPPDQPILQTYMDLQGRRVETIGDQVG
ncbi:NUDIX domain-containing protein [Paenibacillus nanensis]|uniref:NUDIX domain-containing protein n=1 Tax=Paenibacillus nanensis TaxID=393251 RepID=A0A3A1UYN4_9BACL|nr:NUDIX hydrolase [Paenibacillus nanensis]RIX53689.1 NUDIX domain-containing protein [Paenibacillus nanensis]